MILWSGLVYADLVTEFMMTHLQLVQAVGIKPLPTAMVCGLGNLHQSKSMHALHLSILPQAISHSALSAFWCFLSQGLLEYLECLHASTELAEQVMFYETINLATFHSK